MSDKNVIPLKQARARAAKRKESADRSKTLSLYQRIWAVVLAELENEPDAALVGIHIAILYPPDKWVSSGWSAMLKKLFYRNNSKKHVMSQRDMYAELATQYQRAAAGYRALARKTAPPRSLENFHRVRLER